MGKFSWSYVLLSMNILLNNTTIEYNKSSYDIETVFNIHEDLRGNFVFNINETTYFSIPKKMLKSKIIDHPLHWSTISYEIYGNTRLVWFLVKLNNIPLEKMFKRVNPATVVFYIDADLITMLLEKIKAENANK